MRRFAAIVAALCLTACASDAPVDSSLDARRFSASGTVLSADGVRVRYRLSGSGPAMLVFVHGWLCDSRYWRLQVPFFERHYGVLTLDLAGHGESGFGREDWSIQAFAADVAAVVRASSARPIVLIGHSMGGPVVIEAAQLLGEQVAGVVAVDSLREPSDGDIDGPQWRRRLEPFHTDFTAATRRYVTDTMFTTASNPALKEWIIADMAEGPALVGLGALEGLVKFNTAASLQQLVPPFVLISAGYLPTATAWIAATAASARFETIADAGHFLMLERPDEFNSVLASIVADLLQTAAP